MQPPFEQAQISRLNVRNQDQATETFLTYKRLLLASLAALGL
jgi:hypothetical protein